MRTLTSKGHATTAGVMEMFCISFGGSYMTSTFVKLIKLYIWNRYTLTYVILSQWRYLPNSWHLHLYCMKIGRMLWTRGQQTFSVNLLALAGHTVSITIFNSVNKYDCIPIKLYLKTLKFKFHIISTHHEILLFLWSFPLPI